MEEGSRDGSFHVQQEDIKSEVFHQREINLQTCNTGKRVTSVRIKGLIDKGCLYTSQILVFKCNIKLKPEDNVTWREYTRTRHSPKAQGTGGQFTAQL